MNDRNRPSAPQVGVGAVVINDQRILLVKRKNAPKKGKWAIPGGLVELGESLQQAAQREVREETGLTIKAKEPIHTFDLIERTPNGKILFHYVVVDVLAIYVRGKIRSSDDAADARWFSPEELKILEMTETTRVLLKKIGFL